MNIRQKLLVALLVWLSSGYSVRAEIPMGSVLVTRNLNEADNTTPFSYWNHCAIYVGGGEVVESQDGYGVILVRYCDFIARPYVAGILYPRDREVGRRAAAIARTYIGRPYRQASSLAPLVIPPIVPTLLHGTPDGMNCTSVVRDAYESAIGRPLVGFRLPDDATRRGDIFTNRP